MDICTKKRIVCPQISSWYALVPLYAGLLVVNIFLH
jgi:hypothetical protein